VHGDQIATSQEQKQEVLFEFFSNLLGVAKQREFTLELEACHSADVDLGALDLFITEEEVRATIASLPSDKALGLDGYTGRFYKTCWHIIKKLRPAGVRQPPDIVLRRRPSHTGRETPRIPAPPIHSGIETLVRTTTTGAEP
jgi:hypothetical protein